MTSRASRAIALLLTLPLAAQKIAGGPYVSFATTTTATVAWIVDHGPVRFGTDAAALATSAPAFQVHRTTLTGLKPGALYHYEVPGAGRGSFTTPPAATTDTPHTFAVFGDNRTRHEVYRKVAGAVAAAQPTYIVHTGDQVADGTVADQWVTFFDISREMLRHTVFFPSLGNHERNSPYWYRFFDKRIGYYSFNYGKAHWVILNTDVRNVAATEEEREAYWKAQLAWADRDLERNQDAEYLFVAHHHTPITAIKRRYAEAARLHERLWPLYEKHKPSAVFTGHDHNYQRHVKDGIPVVVTGGGGAPLYEVDAPVPGISQVVESIENYVFAQVDAGVIRLEARAIDGRVIDKFEIVSRKAAPATRTP
jgi:hypothetical protein